MQKTLGASVTLKPHEIERMDHYKIDKKEAVKEKICKMLAESLMDLIEITEVKDGYGITYYTYVFVKQE